MNQTSMTKKIFIFRGSPASGKGTITDAFIKTIAGKVAYIELDTFRWGFHLKNRKIADVGDEEHQLAYENYLAVLTNYLKNGTYTIVTEGLFSWSKPGPHGSMGEIISLCEVYDFEIFPILLYADYDVLWERNTKRQYAVPEDEFKILYHNVMDERSDEEIALNVGELSVEESVAALSKFL